MMLQYILDQNGRPRAEKWLLRWSEWMAKHKKQLRVGRTVVGQSTVSTVFLGLDHNFVKGPPILWETMVFGGKLDSYTERCSGSRRDAQAMHRRIVKKVKGQT